MGAAALSPSRQADSHSNSGCLGSTVGGDARARGVLQHDLGWAKAQTFGDMLPVLLKRPWANLREMGDKPIEYSQSDI